MKKSTLPVKLLKEFRKLYRIDRVSVIKKERRQFSLNYDYNFIKYEYYLVRLKDGYIYSPFSIIKDAIVKGMGSMNCVGIGYFYSVTRRRDRIKKENKRALIIKKGIRHLD